MKKVLIYIGLVSAMLFWSITFVWIKQLLNLGLTPTMIIFLRLLIASVILLPLILHSKIIRTLTKTDILLLLSLSFFEPFLYYIGEVNGIKHASPNIAAIIVAIIPIFLPFIMRFFVKENLSTMNYIGLFVSFAGVIIIVFNKDGHVFASFKGLAFLFMAVFSGVAYTIIAKKLLLKIAPFYLVSLKTVIGFMYFIPVFFVNDFANISGLHLSIDVVFKILILAICGNILAYILYNISIKHIGATKTVIFTNLIPVFTIIFSFFILKDTLPIAKYGGIALTLIGIYVSQLKFTLYKTTKFIDK